MKTRTLLAARLLALVGAAFFLCNCSPPREPLRIGLNIWPPYALFQLAQEKGFFAQEGVDVKLFEFASLSDARRAFETAKLDGIATTLVEVLMARDVSSRDLKVLRLINFSEGADVIIAPATAKTMEDLRGKRIGMEPASLTTYLLARALAGSGMKPDEVRIVPGDPATMCTDLLAGRLDAAVTYPPESTRALSDPRFRVLFSSREIPGEIVDVLAMDENVVRKRPRETAALIRGLDRAYEYLQTNEQDALRVMSEWAGMTPEEFGKTLRNGIMLTDPKRQADFFGPNGKLQGTVQTIAQTLRASGLISGRPDVTDCVQEQQ